MGVYEFEVSIGSTGGYSTLACVECMKEDGWKLGRKYLLCCSPYGGASAREMVRRDDCSRVSASRRRRERGLLRSVRRFYNDVVQTAN